MIPDTDTITSATADFYMYSISTGSTYSIALTSSNPDNATDIDAGEYTDRHDGRMDTEYGSSRIQNTSLGGNAYNSWSFSNPNSQISKTGVTEIGLMYDHDFDNVEPSWCCHNGGSEVYMKQSEATGTSQDPKIVIIHTNFIADYDARKSSTETLQSSTVLQADDELRLNLEANKTFIVDGVIFASSTSATPDLKIGFSLPSGATMKMGFLSGNAANFRRADLLENSTTTSDTISLNAMDVAVISIQGTIKTTSQGVLQLLWSQANSNGTPVGVLEGSYLRADEI